MQEIGLSPSAHTQMPHAICAWAIRAPIVAVLVVLADRQTVKTLLLGCVTIDFTDIISAYLSGTAGIFGTADGWLLKLTVTAIAALLLELGGLALMTVANQD